MGVRDERFCSRRYEIGNESSLELIEGLLLLLLTFAEGKIWYKFERFFRSADLSDDDDDEENVWEGWFTVRKWPDVEDEDNDEVTAEKKWMVSGAWKKDKKRLFEVQFPQSFCLHSSLTFFTITSTFISRAGWLYMYNTMNFTYSMYEQLTSTHVRLSVKEDCVHSFSSSLSLPSVTFIIDWWQSKEQKNEWWNQLLEFLFE